MSEESILELGLNSITTLEYLAEGAANVVYRIVPPPPSPSIAADLNFEPDGSSSHTPPPSEIPALGLDPRLESKLARLRKSLPSNVPVLQSQKDFQSLIVPLFDKKSMGDCLVEQTLFRPSRDLIRDCNAKLRKMEADGSRNQKRHGVYLAEDEDYGTLITDMSSTNDNYYACVELKPKWLAQSPSAPAGSRRCRTCALRLMRNATEKHAKPGFCPLSLVSGDKAKVSLAVDFIMSTSKHAASLTETVRTALIDYLHNCPLLELLKNLQLEKDPLGVFQANAQSPDFLTAMTLRDCTLFLKVRRSPIPSYIPLINYQPPKLTPPAHFPDSSLRPRRNRSAPGGSRPQDDQGTESGVLEKSRAEDDR